MSIFFMTHGKARLQKSNYIFLLIVFSCMLIFFISIRPISVISGDDWNNLSMSRSALPEWGGFNPSKVLPELLMTYASRFSAFVISPVGVDYLFSITITTALLMSLILTVLAWEIKKLLISLDGCKASVAYFITFIVFLYLFGLFKTKDGNESLYLLHAINLTCYYHYVIPALINSTFAIYLIRVQNLNTEELSNSASTQSLLTFTAYLCIFSSIFASVILASYCGLAILYKAFVRKSRSLYEYRFNALIIIAWLISALFEMNGGRASQIGESSLLFSDTISYFYGLIKQSHHLFSSLSLLSIITGVFLTFFDRNWRNSYYALTYWLLALSSFFTFLLLMLVCSKAGPEYASRTDAMLGIFIYLLALSCIPLAFLLNKYKSLLVCMPIVILCLFNITVKPSTSLKEPHNLNLSYEEARSISKNLINQVKEADHAGVGKMVLNVPAGDDNDNWPFPFYMGPVVSHTLRTSGIIKNEIDIEIARDENFSSRIDH